MKVLFLYRNSHFKDDIGIFVFTNILMQHLLPKIYGILIVSFKRTKRFSNTAILVYPPTPLLGLLMSLREVPGSKASMLSFMFPP